MLVTRQSTGLRRNRYSSLSLEHWPMIVLIGARVLRDILLVINRNEMFSNRHSKVKQLKNSRRTGAMRKPVDGAGGTLPVVGGVVLAPVLVDGAGGTLPVVGGVVLAPVLVDGAGGTLAVVGGVVLALVLVEGSIPVANPKK